MPKDITKLVEIIGLIRKHPEFFSDLFSPMFLFETEDERNDYLRSGQAFTTDFSKIWDMVDPNSEDYKKLQVFKELMVKTKVYVPNIYRRWREIFDASIKSGAYGVSYRYSTTQRDPLLEFLKEPSKNDEIKAIQERAGLGYENEAAKRRDKTAYLQLTFIDNIWRFFESNKGMLTKLAETYDRNEADKDALMKKDFTKQKASIEATAQMSLATQEKWLGVYRPLIEQIRSALKNPDSIRATTEQELFTMLLNCIKFKKEYLSNLKRAPNIDKKFSETFDVAISRLIIVIRSKAKNNQDLFMNCMSILAKEDWSVRDSFAQYFKDSPAFIATDGKFQLHMPPNFKGTLDIKFDVIATVDDHKLEIPRDLKNFSVGQQSQPGPGLEMTDRGGYYTTPAALLAATTTIVPMGSAPFSVPNTVGKDTTAFAPTRTFKTDGMKFAVVLGKASKIVTLKNFGVFKDVPKQKPIKVDPKGNAGVYKFNVHNLLGLSKDIDVSVFPIGSLLRSDGNDIVGDDITIKHVGDGNYSLQYTPDIPMQLNFDSTSKWAFTTTGFICNIYPAPGQPITQVVITMDAGDLELHKPMVNTKFNFMLPREIICAELLKDGWKVNTPVVESTKEVDSEMLALAKASKQINDHVRKTLEAFTPRTMSLVDLMKAKASAIKNIAEMEDNMIANPKLALINQSKVMELAVEKEKLFRIDQFKKNIPAPTPGPSRIKPR